MASDCVGRLCRAIAKNYHSNDEYFDDIRRRPLSRRSVTFVQLICLYLGTVDRLALGTTLTVGKGMRYDVSILNSSNWVASSGRVRYYKNAARGRMPIVSFGGRVFFFASTEASIFISFELTTVTTCIHPSWQLLIYLLLHKRIRLSPKNDEFIVDGRKTYCSPRLRILHVQQRAILSVEISIGPRCSPMTSAMHLENWLSFAKIAHACIYIEQPLYDQP